MTFNIDKFMTLVASANSAPVYDVVVVICGACGFLLLVTGILCVGHFIECRYGSISNNKLPLKVYVRPACVIIAVTIVIWCIPWLGIKYKDDYLAEAVAMISLHPEKDKILKDQEVASTYTKIVKYFNKKIEDKEKR